MLPFIFLSILVMMQSFSVVTGQSVTVTTPSVTHDLPYALAFEFQNTTLPEGTCQDELAIVTNAAYPVYRLYLVVDSTLKPSNLAVLAHSGHGRRLLRGEGERPKQRQLQLYCYFFVILGPDSG